MGLKQIVGEYFFGSEARDFYRFQENWEIEFSLSRNNSLEKLAREEKQKYVKNKLLSNLMLCGSFILFLATKNPYFSGILLGAGEIARIKFHLDYKKKRNCWKYRRFIIFTRMRERELYGEFDPEEW